MNRSSFRFLLVALCVVSLLITIAWADSSSDQPTPSKASSFPDHQWMLCLLPFQFGTPSKVPDTDLPAAEAPFQLTPERQDYVDRVLHAWEKKTDKMDTFQTRFTLRVYGSVFQTDKSRPTIRQGNLAYQKPNKAFFEIRGDHPEKWTCDGKSVYRYDYDLKELKQYVLPDDLQGQPIRIATFPFLFGSTKASDLKQHYWIRALPSPKDRKNQIWVQIFPQDAREAAQFIRAEMIFSAKDMTPIGIMLHMPNGRETQSYAFSDFVFNYHEKGYYDPPTATSFTPRLPHGWKKVVEAPTTP